MKKNKGDNNKGNNNLYVENPTIGYQESQEQPTYDRKVDSYKKNAESYNNEEDFYEEEDDAYNEEEIYDEKADTKVKQIRAYSNPYIVGGTLYVFWPLGLYWMWKYKVYNKRTRIILSIVMSIYGISRWIGQYTN